MVKLGHSEEHWILDPCLGKLWFHQLVVVLLVDSMKVKKYCTWVLVVGTNRGVLFEGEHSSSQVQFVFFW